MLALPDKGSPKANWKQNASVLRDEMRKGQPIYETFVDDAGELLETGGFLKAERALLESHGWTYNREIRAWLPPLT